MTRRREFTIVGPNAQAFNSRAPEVLLAGPSGTGKTVTLLTKCLTLLGKYPGCRGLLLRGTRASLTQSTLVTWEDAVLGPDHPALTARPALRRVRQSYEFPNRSEMVVAGLDDPGKTLSAEYDFVYVTEATEEGMTLAAYETMLRALRHGRTPFTQMMSDCNPTSPAHWLHKRAQAGGLRMYSSGHKDNPRFYDRARGDWTEAGRAYLATLGRMTGFRRKRFLEGVWAAAEGLVYDGYDPGVHLLPAGWTPPPTWPRVWAVDWGYTAPLVLQFWARDPDWRLYLYREVYRTGMRVDAVAAWAKGEVAACREPMPVALVCDHDAEDAATFAAFGPPGLRVEKADKADRGEGIQAVQRRFDRAGNGEPRVFLVDGCRDHRPDPALEAAGLPTGTLEELAGYTWDPKAVKDQPVEVNDHGCLVAGTLVETEVGPVPIERITPGVRVWTRAGLRPVLAAGCTNLAARVTTLILSTGETVTGTGDHPVLTADRDFVRMDAIGYGVPLVTLEDNPEWTSSLYRARAPRSCGCGSTGLCTAATPRRSVRPTAGTTGAGLGTPFAAVDGCTATSGHTTTARSRTGTMSTTGTGTRRTTPGTTWSVCPPTNTSGDTSRKQAAGAGLAWPPCPPRSGPPCWPLPPNGTARRKGGRGTASTLCGWPSVSSLAAWRARGAALSSRPGSGVERGFVVLTARPPLGGRPGWTTGPGLVSGAAASSSSIATRRDGTAPVRAVGLLSRGGLVPVFNLTVAGQPEFYANSVLVHNCDAMRYVVRWADTKSKLAGADGWATAPAGATEMDRLRAAGTFD